MPEMIGPVYARRDHAGFIRRTVALALDLAILFAAHLLTGEALAYLAPDTWYDPEGWLLPEVVVTYEFSFWVLAVIYMFGFRLSPFGTPGYRIMRIRYAYAFERGASPLMVLYRAGIAVFLMLFFLLDHLWILFDPHKQAWHDKVSGFYVVKCGAEPIGMRPVRRRYINFMMLTFPVWEPDSEESV